MGATRRSGRMLLAAAVATLLLPAGTLPARGRPGRGRGAAAHPAAGRGHLHCAVRAGHGAAQRAPGARRRQRPRHLRLPDGDQPRRLGGLRAGLIPAERPHRHRLGQHGQLRGGDREPAAHASATSGLSGSSSVGTPQVSVIELAPNASGETPGLVIITVPTSELGTPGAGWTFTVTLTGQDGFGVDDARTFTATPGAYTFGVCSSAVASEPSPPATCSYNPSAVPFVMDTIPPAGVNVQTELDPTVNPSGVARQGVTVP